MAGSGCYYPDGMAPTDYVFERCTGDTVSSCCIPSEGDVCLASGLCYWPGGQYPFRGACTDKTWQDSKCPKQYCPDTYREGWQGMVKCSGNKYCCSPSQGDLGCCNNPSGLFTVDINAVIHTYGTTTGGPAFTATTRVASSSTKKTTSTATSSASGKGNSTVAVTGAVNGVTSTSTSSLAKSTSTSVASSSSSSAYKKLPIVLLSMVFLSWAC